MTQIIEVVKKQKKWVAFLAGSILLMGVIGILIATYFPVAASDISPNTDNSYVFYTNSLASTTLPLAEDAAAGTSLLAFTQEGQTYTCVSRQNLQEGEETGLLTDLPLPSGSIYMVGISSLSEDEISVGTILTTEGTDGLVIDGQSINLQSIEVREDTAGPVIQSVVLTSAKLLSSDYLEVTFSVTDSAAGVDEGTIVAELLSGGNTYAMSVLPSRESDGQYSATISMSTFTRYMNSYGSLPSLQFRVTAKDRVENENTSTQALPDVKYTGITEVAGTTQTGTAYVKIGEQIYVRFTTADSVSSNEISATIAGQSATKTLERTQDGRSYWKLSYTIPSNTALTDGDPIRFSITVNDNGKSATVDQTAASEVTYQTSIEISGLTYDSSNVDSALVHNGETITVSFTTRQSLSVSSSSIAGKTATSNYRNSNGLYTWTITRVIQQNDITYNGEVPFSLSIKKGGETQIFTQEDCDPAASVCYELPFSVSGFSIVSNNADGQAATGTDMLHISFVTSADVHVNASSIANIGQDPVAFVSSVQADGSLLWTSSRVACTSNTLVDAGKIPFVVNLSDNSGNNAQITQDNAASSVIFYKPIQATIRSVTNSGAENYTKNGDIITVAFTTTHGISLAGLTCGNLDKSGIEYTLTQTDTAGMAWTLSFRVKEGMYNNNTVAAFSMDLMDAAGNTTTIARTETGIPTFLAPIEITAISVTSSNGEPTAAKVGDTVSITFLTNNPIRKGDMYVGGIIYNYYLTEDPASNTSTISYPITEEMYEDGEVVQFSLAIRDEAENTATITNETASSFVTPSVVTFYGNLSVTGLSAVSSNAGSSSIAASGDTITLSFQTQHPAVVSSLYIAGDSVLFTANSVDNKGMDWTLTYVTTASMYEDNQEVSFSVQVSDVAGNYYVITQEQRDALSVPIHYYAPLTQEGVIYDISFTTSNATQGDGDGNVYTRNGDTLTVQFRTTHPILLPVGSVAGSSAIFTNSSGDGMHWTATYVVPEETADTKAITDNADLDYSIVVQDAAGNQAVTLDKTRTAPIRYLAPIADGLSAISFVSDNETTSGCYANNVSMVTLSFSSTHKLAIDSAEIADTGISFTEASTSKGYAYTVTVPVSSMSIGDNQDVPFTYRLTDRAGNEAVTRTDANASKIRYQAPISVQQISMASNNLVSSTLSVNGNLITVRFYTTHPVILSDTKIAGQAVTFTSMGGDGMHWEATYLVKDGDAADLSVLSLAVFITDLSGNTPVNLTQQTTGVIPITYYAPIAITNLQITSSNANSTAMYAKNGDTVFVSFTTNHEITVSNARISGQAVSQSEESGQAGANSKKYTFSYVVQDGVISDLEAVTFAFTGSDLAGNEPISKTEQNTLGANQIVYYAPISSITNISSDGIHVDYAKNGDTITLDVETNHNVTVQSADIFGRTTMICGADTPNPTMTYKLPASERVISEGIVTFAYRITDVAGNVYEASEEDGTARSQVIYDRTAPEMTVTPRFNGFTNQTVIFDATFKDANLDRNGMSILLNGAEQITSASRLAQNGATYEQAVTIETDELYKLTASVSDMAGNRAAPDFSATITIDKTAPTVSSATISFSDPQVYKTGFVLGAQLDIVDENVSQVICMLTDADGSRNWDLDDPILTDGKKTIYLLVTDFAGNASKEIVFDMYIDATAPVPIVSDTISGRSLTAEEKEQVFLSDMTLNISLQDINLGNEEVDHFTMLKLLDEDGRVVLDILGTMNPNEDGSYTLTLSDFGSYTIQAEAVDDVGNSTGLIEYAFHFKDKSVFVKFYENKPAFYSTSTVFGVLVIGGMVLIAKRRRSK